LPPSVVSSRLVRCYREVHGPTGSQACHAADASAGWMPMGCHPGPSFSWDAAWTLRLASTRTRASPDAQSDSGECRQTGELVTS
jgi:hypothetical protein